MKKIFIARAQRLFLAKAFILGVLVSALCACNHFRPCINLKQFSHFFTMDLIGEPYGATDINAITGNQGLTVAVNAQGTITVFKWPNPSFYDQVAYMTTERQAPNLGALPTEGIFAGVYWETDREKGFFWLRELNHQQKYLSASSVVIQTSFFHPELGLEIDQIDLVEPSADIFWRNFQVRKLPSSKVQRAQIVSYAHFAPQISKLSRLPLTDWCLERIGNSTLKWNPEKELFLQTRQGTDLSTKRPSAIALAFGFAEKTNEHWTGKEFPYLPASASCARKSSALSAELSFDEFGKASASFIISASRDAKQAISLLDSARQKGFTKALSETESYWNLLLKKVPLPNTDNERIIEVALRSVIVLLLGYCKDTGAIVASVSTQPPYGEDWQRDGAYLNEALLTAGFPELVKKHNLFYARVQSQPGHKLPMVPFGNWASNYFADGVPGFPLLWWEIDETGFALWTLWRYYEFSLDREYLEQIYPAIKRSADFLVEFRDQKTGLTKKAYESDETKKLQSLRGALSAHLGLTYAMKVGEVMGDDSSVKRWQARREELTHLILERYYDSACERFIRFEEFRGNCEQGAAGWEHATIIWPAELFSFSDPRAQASAKMVWREIEPSFLGKRDRGLYEMYGLLSLAKIWKNEPEKMELIKKGLEWELSVPITDTGLFGEVWLKIGDKVYAGQSQPQLWQHSAFYLLTLEIFGKKEEQDSSAGKGFDKG